MEKTKIFALKELQVWLAKPQKSHNSNTEYCFNDVHLTLLLEKGTYTLD